MLVGLETPARKDKRQTCRIEHDSRAKEGKVEATV